MSEEPMQKGQEQPLHIPAAYGGTAYAAESHDPPPVPSPPPTERNSLRSSPPGTRQNFPFRSADAPRRPHPAGVPQAMGMSPTAQAYFAGNFAKRVEEAEAKAEAAKQEESGAEDPLQHSLRAMLSRPGSTEDILLAGLLVLLAREGAEEETLLALGALLLL